MSDWPGLIGMSRAELALRTGGPGRERAVGDDLWAVFDLPGRVLRVRLHSDPTGDYRVVSWTATLHEPALLLSDATRPLDLWPAARPEAEAAREKAPLVRRPLSGPDGRCHSLTATIRRGKFTAVTVFDEHPEWTTG